MRDHSIPCEAMSSVHAFIRPRGYCMLYCAQDCVIVQHAADSVLLCSGSVSHLDAARTTQDVALRTCAEMCGRGGVETVLMDGNLALIECRVLMFERRTPKFAV